MLPKRGRQFCLFSRPRMLSRRELSPPVAPVAPLPCLPPLQRKRLSAKESSPAQMSSRDVPKQSPLLFFEAYSVPHWIVLHWSGRRSYPSRISPSNDCLWQVR